MTPTAIASYSGTDTERADAPTLVSPEPALPGELWGVVLAGGEGIRLRPLTRVICGDERPKQYVTLTGVTWCDWGSPRRVVESLERLGIRPSWLDRLSEPAGAGSER